MALPIRLRLTLTYGGLLFLALVLSGSGVMTLLRHRLNMRRVDPLTLIREGRH